MKKKICRLVLSPNTLFSLLARHSICTLFIGNIQFDAKTRATCLDELRALVAKHGKVARLRILVRRRRRGAAAAGIE